MPNYVKNLFVVPPLFYITKYAPGHETSHTYRTKTKLCQWWFKHNIIYHTFIYDDKIENNLYQCSPLGALVHSSYQQIFKKTF